MNERLKMILSEFLFAKDNLTGEYLANVVNVSSRTIRSDIKELNELLKNKGGNIYSIRGKGYRLNIDNNNLFDAMIISVFNINSSMIDKNIPIEKSERVNYILIKLLLASDFLKQDNIAEEMFVSKSTLQIDMINVKEILNAYKLKLIKKPNYGIKVEGDEMKIRLCLRTILFSRNTIKVSSSNSFSISSNEADNIKNIILNQIQKFNVILSDIALNNLTIHLLIAINRIQDKKFINTINNLNDDIFHKKEYEIAKNIILDLSQFLNISFPKSEIIYLSLHLVASKGISQDDININEYKNFIDPYILGITTTILEEIESRLNLNIINDTELFIGLSLHIQASINRYKYDIGVTNIMIKEIRKSNPVAFEAGLIAGSILEKYKIETKVDEIAFLAIHIATAIERKKNISKPKRCIIVCVSGFGSAKLLYYKLKNIFQDSIEIIDTIEYYNLKKFDLKSVDFIISTVDIPDPITVPIIVINTILDNIDIKKIDKFLSNNKDKFIDYFDKELSFFLQDFKTKKDVIDFISVKLEEKNIVNSDFKNSVYERESIFPTSYGNLVAIPHPIVPLSSKTLLVACFLKKSILWDTKPVQLVFMICIGKKDESILENMYYNLIALIDNNNMINKLVKCKNFNEFGEIILEFS